MRMWGKEPPVEQDDDWREGDWNNPPGYTSGPSLGLILLAIASVGLVLGLVWVVGTTS